MFIEGLLQLKNYSRLWGYSSEKNKDFAWIDYIIRIQIVNKSSAAHNVSTRGKKTFKNNSGGKSGWSGIR